MTADHRDFRIALPEEAHALGVQYLQVGVVTSTTHNNVRVDAK